MSSATTKRLGAAIVLVLAPVLHVAPGSTWIRTTAAIAAGLMMIFFSRASASTTRGCRT